MLNYFIVHRPLRGTGLDVQDMLDETLAMAVVDNMKLVSSFTFKDAASVKHLYLIFEQEYTRATSFEETKYAQEKKVDKKSKPKGRKTKLLPKA